MGLQRALEIPQEYFDRLKRISDLADKLIKEPGRSPRGAYARATIMVYNEDRAQADG